MMRHDVLVPCGVRPSPQCTELIWDPSVVDAWPHLYRCPNAMADGASRCDDHRK